MRIVGLILFCLFMNIIILINNILRVYKVRDQNTKCWKTRWHVAPIGMPR